MIRNFEYLDDYYRRLDVAPPIDAETVAKVRAAVTNVPGITKAELLHQEPHLSTDTLHRLIVEGQVHVDLRQCSLADEEHVHLYRDSEQAQAYDLCSSSASPARPAWLTGTELLRCEPGAALTWDGKPWRITNVGDTHVYLQLQDGASETVIGVDQTHLQRLFHGGHISPIRVEDQDNVALDDDSLVAEAQRRLLSHAHPNKLRRALQRHRFLQRFWAGDLTVLDEVSTRSLYGFQRRWREAKAVGRPGFTGLIDRHTNSGRSQQLSDEARALLLTSIREDYGSKRQLTIRGAYRAYLGCCGALGASPVSYETYRATVHRQPLAEQTLRRRGRRAAYAASPFTSLIHGNRHGDYPLQRVHGDHTQIDLEVLSPLGESLGRPWFTALFDAYSRRVLAFYLTFDEPSYRSCMMVLRECVRRQGRLPSTLIFDNAPEFGSVYLETLLAAYEVTLESRPKAKARYGAVIERMFGTLNSEFIHTLRGNTQIMRHVREVTKAVDPRGQAVWTLPGLYDAMTEWCYEVYDQQPHEGLHYRSPRTMFLAGQATAGARADSYVSYNKEFLRLTEPTTPKGTARVSANGLVKVNYILYSCPEFVSERVQGADVPVRYDPDDSGHIHALVNGVLVECRANNYDVFALRSEREVEMASKEIRALDRQAGRTPTVSHSRLVEFFYQIQEHEDVLLQHKRDQEARRARAGNSVRLGDTYETKRNTVSSGEAQGQVMGDATTLEMERATASLSDAEDADVLPGVANATDAANSGLRGARSSRLEDDAPDLCDDF